MDRRNAGAGIIGAIATGAVVAVLPHGARIDVLAGLLWLTVGMFLGMALMDRTKHLKHEALGGLVTLVLAVLGVTVSPWFLVAGWITHPAWDLLHAAGIVKTHIHKATVPFCITYDLMVAAVAAWVAATA